MASIIIREKDLTTNAISSDVSEVAYVPGFGSFYEADAPLCNSDDAGKPVLCTSVAQFRNYFGSEPLKYTVDYKYVEYDADGNEVEVWDATEKPNLVDSKNTCIFNAGCVETGYMYAYELLNSGIPVYYQRVNEATDVETVDIDYKKFTAVAGKDVVIKNIKAFEIKVAYPNATDPTTYDYLDEADYTFDNGTLTIEADKLTAGTIYTVKLTEVLTVDAKKMYEFLENADNLDQLRDRGEFNFKYFTTGGYPTFGYKENVIIKNVIGEGGIIGGEGQYAEERDTSSDFTGRADCVFLVDHTCNHGRKLFGTGSVFEAVNSATGIREFGEKAKFSAMFTPWGEYTMTSAFADKMILPASFGYLRGVANSYVDSPNMAVSGVARGTISGFTPYTKDVLTNNIANKCQLEVEPTGTDDGDVISINCITRIRPYGYCIWGNRTCQLKDAVKGYTATGFLSVRNIVSEIRKLCYTTARRYMYENNSDVLKIQVRASITPFLDSLVASHCLDSYQMTIGKDSGKHKLVLYISITPLYPVESFDFTIEITDGDNQ